MRSAIQISNLTKVYHLPRGKKKTAVNSIDLEVQPGEIFGFLGPNGAGKTSTVKILLGFIKPTSGSASLLGIPIDNPKARASVGYLPEQPYFHKFMTPAEVVSVHAGLADVPRRERKRRVTESIETVGLAELARTPISKMSKGQVQRVGLAQALVGDPELLILDEPASGLDPLGRRQVRDLLMKLKDAGKTIFLSSHLLSEIETVCDRVAVLSHGKLMAAGTPEELKNGANGTRVVTGLVDSRLEEYISDIGGEISADRKETTITIESERLYDLIDLLRTAGQPLISVSADRESLEEAFLRLAA